MKKVEKSLTREEKNCKVGCVNDIFTTVGIQRNTKHIYRIHTTEQQR